jgi:hypothetical protein
MRNGPTLDRFCNVSTHSTSTSSGPSTSTGIKDNSEGIIDTRGGIVLIDPNSSWGLWIVGCLVMRAYFSHGEVMCVHSFSKFIDIGRRLIHGEKEMTKM